MNARNSTPEFRGIRRSIDYAVNRLVADGEPMTTVSYTDSYVIDKLRRESAARTNNPLTKRMLRSHGREDGWLNVQRMTFFGPQHTKSVAQRVASKLLSAKVWVPELYEIGDCIGIAVRASGEKYGLSTLQKWRPNRYGINVLFGSSEHPAVIAPHPDVSTEHGVVVALDLSGTPGCGNLSFIFGRDTCDSLGLEQSVHGVVSESRRVSVTLADLRSNTH